MPISKRMPNAKGLRAAPKSIPEYSQHGPSDYVSGITFVGKDIQRHPAVKEVLRIYQELN
jgi:hypothetical protein